ncbi:MAG: ATP-binding cassette domain-containing protein, partial [Chromatiales bacterium]|nr:ATP-binding cassette domain-containing protein [Chromatiales bacterium]
MQTTSLRRLRPLAALLPYIRPHLRTALFAAAALLFAAVFMLSMPAAVGVVIDRGMLAQSEASVDRYFVTLFTLAVLAGAFGAVRYYLVSWLGERVVADLRNDVYSHVLTLGPTFFEEHRSGEVLSRLNTDTTLVQSMAGINLSIALRSALMMLGALTMLAVTSPRLTGYIIVMVPAVLVPLLGYGRHVRRLSKATQDRVADTGGIAGETVGAIQTVQAFGLENMQAARFADAIANAFSTAVARIRARAYLTAGSIIILFGAVVAVLWLGARDVVAGQMSAGELGQFLLYAVMVAGSAASLSEMWGEVQRAAGAMERVMGLLDAQPQIESPKVPRPLPVPARGEIELRGVEFRYPARPDVAALENMHLHVSPGETVALVGESGAGKTTVMQLLLRFYDPTQGGVLLDG